MTVGGQILGKVWRGRGVYSFTGGLVDAVDGHLPTEGKAPFTK